MFWGSVLNKTLIRSSCQRRPDSMHSMEAAAASALRQQAGPVAPDVFLHIPTTSSYVQTLEAHNLWFLH